MPSKLSILTGNYYTLQRNVYVILGSDYYNSGYTEINKIHYFSFFYSPMLNYIT